MRIFKPLQLSLLTKSFTWDDKHHLAVTVLLAFPFDDSKECLLEQDLWSFVPDQLGKEGILDLCMPKPNAEVVMYGNFYAPNAEPLSAGHAQLKIGSVDKTLAVVGDRYWRGLLAPTAPEEFTQMPLNYEYAFGGEGFKENPDGKGLAEVDVFGEMKVPLPNIEYPDKLMTSPGQRPAPAGFSPLNVAWQKRMSKSGTYDEKWKENYFPAPPPDLNWEIYNTVEEDQWIPEFWQGNESFELHNVHKDKAILQGQLPKFNARCVVAKDLESGGVNCSEVGMKAETVFLFPEVETGIMLFRGSIQVEEDDASDIDHILVAYEDMMTPSEPFEYYQTALENRLDDNKVFKYMLSTKDIIPKRETCGFKIMLDNAGIEDQSALNENLNQRVEDEKSAAMEKLEEAKQELKAKLEKAGVDPEQYLAQFDKAPETDPMMDEFMEILEKLLPGISTNDVSQLKIEEIDFSQFKNLDVAVEKFKTNKLDEVKEQLLLAIEKLGDTEKDVEAKQKLNQSLMDLDRLPLLPRAESDEFLKMLTQQEETLETYKQQLPSNVQASAEPIIEINLEEVRGKIDESFTQLRQAYLIGAQYIEGRPPHKEPLDIIKYRFEKSLNKGERVTGKDWSGVDFSGMDLSGINLSFCYLEYANFTDCNLNGANLESAVITHANLTRANLSSVNLSNTNLGGSDLTQASLSDIEVSDLILTKAILKNATVSRCNFENLMLLDAELTHATFEQCQLNGINILELDLSHSRFIDCQLKQCNFIKSNIEHSQFMKSDLSGSNFVECNIAYGDFSDAIMTNVRFPSDCTLSYSLFKNALIDKANFQNVIADHCIFEFSNFSQSDFSGANLQHCKFYSSKGIQSRFIKSDLLEADISSVNLMESTLQKARLTNADLSFSNLYSADLVGATIGDTNFKGANLDLTILEDWRP